jgi:membrane protein
MRFPTLAVALIAAIPLVSKVITAGPAGGNRTPDSTRHHSSGFNWKNIQEILLSAYRGVGEHRTSLLAAGVAFYALFAIFPALGAATWIFGLLAEPAAIHSELDSMKDVLPAEGWQIVDRQLTAFSANSAKLSFAGIFSLLVALYSARTAASAMMEALNTVYGVPEKRGFLVTNGIAILFTLMGIAVMLIAVAVMIVLPILFNYVGLSSAFAEVVRYARWPALAVLTALALAVTYRFGPDRVNARWKWLSWGSGTATVLWLIASFGFSWYVSAFNSYDKVYGSIGAVIILLFWFWLAGFSGLLGAELDNAIERSAGTPPAGPKAGPASGEVSAK